MGTPGPSLLGTWESSGLNRRFPVPQKLVATGPPHRESACSACTFLTPQAVLGTKSASKTLVFALISH